MMSLSIKKNYVSLFSALLCACCAMILLNSCDKPPETKAKPSIVRKKIGAQPQQSTSPAQAPKTPTQQPRPTAKLQATDAAGKPAQPTTEPTKEAAPTVIAKKIQPQTQRETTQQQAAIKKPAPRPKADLSITPKFPSSPATATAITKPTPPANGAPTQIAKSQTPSPVAQAIQLTGAPPVYNPRGKIDPFEPLFKEKPVVAEQKKKKKKRKKRIPRTPLEKIDISQLKLVAIILAESGNRALVEESSGKGYVVKKGTYIGINAGKVVEIKKNKVVVAEEVEDVLGNVTIRNSELKLPKPPGEL